MSWSRITWMRELGRFVFGATRGVAVAVAIAVAIAEMAARPERGVFLWQIDTTIIPWVAVGIEASG